MAEILDPKSINQRLYNQLARLLDYLESADRDGMMTMPQRINALIAIGRLQVMFVGLRKEPRDPGREGRAVRKYAKAFAADATGRRKAASGPAEAIDDNPGFDPESDPPDSAA